MFKYDIVDFLDFIDENNLEIDEEGLSQYLTYSNSLKAKDYSLMTSFEKIKFHIYKAKLLNDYAAKRNELNKALEISNCYPLLKIEELDSILLKDKTLDMYIDLLNSLKPDELDVDDLFINKDTRYFLVALEKTASFLLKKKEYSLALKTYEKILNLAPNDLQDISKKLAMLYLNDGLMREAFDLLAKYNKNDGESYLAFAIYCFCLNEEDRAFSFLEKMDKKNHYIIYLISKMYLDYLEYDLDNLKLKEAYITIEILDCLNEDLKNNFTEYVKNQVQYFKIDDLITDNEKMFLKLINEYYDEYGKDSEVDSKALLMFSRKNNSEAANIISKMSIQKIESIVDSLVKNGFMEENGEFTNLAAIFMNLN